MNFDAKNALRVEPSVSDSKFSNGAPAAGTVGVSSAATKTPCHKSAAMRKRNMIDIAQISHGLANEINAFKFIITDVGTFPK